MIAQEVQKVIPEVINVEKWVDNSDERTVSEDGVLGPEMPGKPDSWADDDDDILSVEYGHLVGLLVEGMKEQQEMIDSQNAQIAELKEMVMALIK